MKHFTITALSFAALFLCTQISCKKSEDTPTPQVSEKDQYWQFGYSRDTVRFYNWSESKANYINLVGPDLSLCFYKMPDRSGHFRIVGNPVKDDEVKVLRSYYSSDYSSVDSGYYMDVELSNGHFHFVSHDFLIFRPAGLGALLGEKDAYLHCSLDLTDN